MIKYFMSDLVIGLVVVGLGIWTWKKQNLVILHEYHLGACFHFKVKGGGKTAGGKLSLDFPGEFDDISGQV